MTTSTAQTAPTLDQPLNHLAAFILGVLTPLLMTAGITDIALARIAATETIAAYKANGPDQLVSVGQLVGFALASMDNLRLSADAAMSVSMKLKLRGGASALSHSTQRGTVALATQQRTSQDPNPAVQDNAEQDDTAAETEALAALGQARAMVDQAASAARKPTPDPTLRSDPNPRLSWANGMTDVAAELSRNLGKMSPTQRRADIIRINALSETVRHLTRGNKALCKTDLLTSTSLGGSGAVSGGIASG